MPEQKRKRVQTTELSLSVLFLPPSPSLSLYGAWSMGRLRVERNVSRGQLISYVMRREREEAPWIYERGGGMCRLCSARGVVAGPAPAPQYTTLVNNKPCGFVYLIIVGAGM